MVAITSRDLLDNLKVGKTFPVIYPTYLALVYWVYKRFALIYWVLKKFASIYWVLKQYSPIWPFMNNQVQKLVVYCPNFLDAKFWIAIKLYFQDGNFNAMSVQFLKPKADIGIMLWYMINELMVITQCWFRHSKCKYVMRREYDIIWRWLTNTFGVSLFYHNLAAIFF